MRIRFGLSFLLILVLMIFGSLAPSVNAEPYKVVSFPDAKLNQLIHNALGIPLSQDIHESDLSRLEILSWFDDGITNHNLSGIEYCTSLVELHFSEVKAVDYSPLSKLVNLQKLSFWRGNISDVSFLGSLLNLKELVFAECAFVSDISPMKYLTNLTKFVITLSTVNDVTPLRRLTNLTWLTIARCNVNDIQPLVDNMGLGAGDYINIVYNHLDLSSSSQAMQDIQVLLNRGIAVLYVPQSP